MTASPWIPGGLQLAASLSFEFLAQDRVPNFCILGVLTGCCWSSWELLPCWVCVTYCIIVVVNFHRVLEKSMYVVNFTDHAGFKLKIRPSEHQLPAVTYCYLSVPSPPVPPPLGIKKLGKVFVAQAWWPEIRSPEAM